MVWQAIAGGLAQAAGGAAGGAAASAATNPFARAAQYEVNRAYPNALPPVEAILQAATAGTMGPSLVGELLAQHGVSIPSSLSRNPGRFGAGWTRLRDAWDQCYQASLSVPAPGELLGLLTRDQITEAEFVRYMRRNGMSQPDVLQTYRKLAIQIPPPSDLVSFALKEAWDPQVVARFGYDLEYPREFSYWMERQGYSGDARTPAQVATGVRPVDWAQMYWRTHWQAISPGQAYQMFQRLRPNRVARLQAQLPGLRPFTAADMYTALKVADYPEPFRSQLAAVAYRTPRLVDLTKMVDLGLVGLDELTELHLDLGYDPSTAAARAQFVIRDRNRARMRAILGNTRATIMEAYRVGGLTREQAARELYLITFAGLPLGDLFQRSPRAEQDLLIADQPGIRAALDAEDRKLTIKYIKEVTASVRKRYMTGMLSGPQALRLLEDAGIDPVRVRELIEHWLAALAGPRMFVSTAKVVAWARTGIIPMTVAQQYLINLGWQPPDLVFMLAEAQRGYLLQVRQEEERTARTAQQRQRAQEAVVREHEAQARAARAELVRQASVTDLTRFYVRGIINSGLFQSSLAARGYQPDIIAARLADADLQRAERAARSTTARSSTNAGSNGANTANGQAPQAAGTP